MIDYVFSNVFRFPSFVTPFSELRQLNRTRIWMKPVATFTPHFSTVSTLNGQLDPQKLDIYIVQWLFNANFSPRTRHDNFINGTLCKWHFCVFYCSYISLPSFSIITFSFNWFFRPIQYRDHRRAWPIAQNVCKINHFYPNHSLNLITCSFPVWIQAIYGQLITQSLTTESQC